jgi:hypothetical protein
MPRPKYFKPGQVTSSSTTLQSTTATATIQQEEQNKSMAPTANSDNDVAMAEQQPLPNNMPEVQTQLTTTPPLPSGDMREMLKSIPEELIKEYVLSKKDLFDEIVDQLPDYPEEENVNEQPMVTD